jgi:OOP family OmpA-OmpF porin
MAQAGLGAFINVTDNLALRVDGRYRLDANDGDFYSQSKFEDYVAMLGVVWRFGGKEAAPVAAAATVAAAAVVAAPKDTDGDGVTDDLDKCPGTPAGTKVDEKGCLLVTDSDADGVPDEKDLCPNTPAGVKVTATGCSEAAILHGVTFKTGSAELLPSSKETLDKAGRILRDDPTIKVYLDGHTDSQGAAAPNKSLSERRATSVKNYLVSVFGLDASRLTVRGYGEEYPIADNKTAAGRAQNRRVELNPIKE